jgi:hypothetical protein
MRPATAPVPTHSAEVREACPPKWALYSGNQALSDCPQTESHPPNLPVVAIPLPLDLLFHKYIPKINTNNETLNGVVNL